MFPLEEEEPFADDVELPPEIPDMGEKNVVSEPVRYRNESAL